MGEDVSDVDLEPVQGQSSVMLVGSCIPATSYQVLLSEIGNFVVLAI